VVTESLVQRVVRSVTRSYPEPKPGPEVDHDMAEIDMEEIETIYRRALKLATEAYEEFSSETYLRTRRME
jgi:hypothetical protein